MALSRGQSVLLADGSVRPIAITATPIVETSAELTRRGVLSSRLATAGVKMARAILEGPDPELLLASLAPLERAVVERSFRGLERLVLSRVDFFVADGVKALELNATIPAMPVYSDLAAHTYIDVVGAYAGLKPQQLETLREANGSNTRSLYRALLAGYAVERNGATPERIAILVRRNDAQTSEILHLARSFSSLGTETEIVHPDEVGGTAGFWARGKRFDLVYRHLFVRRLEEIQAPWLVEFLSQASHPHTVLFNRPAAHVETKTNFALLSQATGDARLAEGAGLTVDELQAIAETVPWTRPLQRKAGLGPDGVWASDLAARVAAEPERFVIKRSWDYGGRAVFVGRAIAEPSFEERVLGAYGKNLAWPELVAHAAADLRGGGFIVQEVVDAKPQTHWLCNAEGLKEVSLYVDFSAFASVGIPGDFGWTGAVRGSPSRVVNIQGGGGVLPLLKDSVWEQLCAALARRPR